MAGKTIVLVHGAFADHHAFDAVVPFLRDAGYRVLAPDLAAHGDDTTPPASVRLQTYVDAIRAVVESERDVVLAGHSMAGMIVSQVAEAAPDNLRAVIYLAAYLPQDKQTLQQLAETDGESLIGRNMEFAADYSTVSINKHAVAQAIGADLPAPLQQLIVETQKPEPLQPFRDPVALTPAKFGRVRKAYLRTEQDQAVTPALQTRMLAAYPSIPTTALNTSHLPFLAQPRESANAIVALAERAR